MRRLLTLAAAGAALTASAAQAQTSGGFLSWPGKTAPAPAPAHAGPTPEPMIAATTPARARGLENRYSPRTSAPRQMARMNIPAATVYAPPPAYVPPPIQAPAPFVAAPVTPYARPASPSSIFDSTIPDRGFEPVAAPAPVAVAPAVRPRPTAPAQAAPTETAARTAVADGPRYYSVHREFGEKPDRTPHPAVTQGPAADPLPTAFFNAAAPEEEDAEILDERPVQRQTAAKPKRKSAKR